MIKLFYLCWKSFIKGNYWLYLGVSFFLGFPFIQFFSIIFGLPYKTGDFNFKSVLLLGIFWLFFMQVFQLANCWVNKKKVINYWDVFWSLIGFSIALFLMR
jgi:hypothetical protein